MSFYHIDDIPADLKDFFEPAPQIGLEETLEEYIAEMVAVFAQVRRVLRDDGTLWLNLGDSYANDGKWGGQTGGKHARALHGGATANGRNKKYSGFKPKDLMGVPWAVAFALRADGWYLRQDIIWAKPNPMPESVTDRCTKAHEYLFLLSKSAQYYCDMAAIKETSVYLDEAGMDETGFKDAKDYAGKNSSWKGSEFQTGKTGEHQLGRSQTGRTNGGKDVEFDGMRNKRSVWTVATQPYAAAHFATFPPKLIEPCIKAGCPAGGIVLDCFNGAGTTGLVCQQQHVKYVGIELNEKYCQLTKDRLAQGVLTF